MNTGLSLAPGFSPVLNGGRTENRFNSFPRSGKPLKRLAIPRREHTRLKPGANEKSILQALVLAVCLLPVASFADEADDQAQAIELAKKLQNPVANLVSVPIANNWDFGIGAANAMRYTANVQPVIPFSLGEDWNLVTRTIVPIIYAESPTVGGSAKSGLGDVLQSFFFSPREKTSGGWVWGAGPVLLWPTATDSALGGEKWGAGPTALLLRQDSGWTYGALANHVWSYAGDSSRADVSRTLMQPFVAYVTKTRTTFGIGSESSYDWENHQWTVPLTPTVSQMVKIGKQPISLGLSFDYYIERPSGAQDWGMNFKITFVFPKYLHPSQPKS